MLALDYNVYQWTQSHNVICIYLQIQIKVSYIKINLGMKAIKSPINKETFLDERINRYVQRIDRLMHKDLDKSPLKLTPQAKNKKQIKFQNAAKQLTAQKLTKMIENLEWAKVKLMKLAFESMFKRQGESNRLVISNKMKSKPNLIIQTNFDKSNILIRRLLNLVQGKQLVHLTSAFYKLNNKKQTLTPINIALLLKQLYIKVIRSGKTKIQQFGLNKQFAIKNIHNLCDEVIKYKVIGGFRNLAKQMKNRIDRIKKLITFTNRISLIIKCRGYSKIMNTSKFSLLNFKYIYNQKLNKFRDLIAIKIALNLQWGYFLIKEYKQGNSNHSQIRLRSKRKLKKNKIMALSYKFGRLFQILQLKFNIVSSVFIQNIYCISQKSMKIEGLIQSIRKFYIRQIVGVLKKRLKFYKSIQTIQSISQLCQNRRVLVLLASAIANIKINNRITKQRICLNKIRCGVLMKCVSKIYINILRQIYGQIRLGSLNISQISYKTEELSFVKSRQLEIKRDSFTAQRQKIQIYSTQISDSQE